MARRRVRNNGLYVTVSVELRRYVRGGVIGALDKRQAEDAVVIDNSLLSREEQMDKIIAIFQNRLNGQMTK